MGFDIAGEVGGASEEAGVEVSLRLELRGNIGDAAEKPNLFSRADGDGSRFDGDAHCSIKLMKCEHEPILMGTNGDQMAGLIG